MSIRADIAELSSETAEMALHIKSLNRKLKEYKGSQESAVNELRSQIQELHEKMASYQEQIDALREQLANNSRKEEMDSKESEDDEEDNEPVSPLARREVQILESPAIDEEIEEIDHISGWKMGPRPTVHFKSGKTINVWNRRAPFGSSVGNWQPADEVAIARKRGGNGIDPYIVRNKKVDESVDGNKNGNPFKDCQIL